MRSSVEASEPSGASEVDHFEDDFALSAEVALRLEASRLIACLLIVLSLVLMVGLEYVPISSAAAVWVGIFALGGTGLLVFAILRWDATLASLTLTGLLLGLCLGEAAIFGSILPLLALPLVVTVAGASLGSAAGIVCAALASLGMLLLTPTGSVAYTVQDTLAPLLFTATAAALVWLGNRPTQIALAWAWSSYSRMRELTVELRHHQGELAKALKSLNHAYYQLERTSEELARARAAAEEARSLKAEFAASLSHELRTPLNLIIGFSEMMLFAPHAESGPPLSAIHRGDVEAIYRNARHLSNLIDDVLELGEIEVGRMGLRKDWADLGDIADEAINVVATLFEDKGLILATEIPTDLPRVYVDRTRIRQVFINLLNNAARFTEQGSVRIGARLVERDVVVTVTDTGIGIRAEDLPHVFEEFRRFQTPQHDRTGGSGLGLAICKKFVELHGGNIGVECVPGTSTTFSFSLPLVHNVAGIPLRAPWDTWARPPAPRADEEPVVLVASADSGSARLFQRHLDGFRVLTTGDPTALQDGGPVQAVIRILDQHDDLATATEGAALAGIRAPLFFCRLPSARDLSQELSVTDYLVKPFTREQLLAALGRVPTSVQTVMVVDDDPSMVDLISRVLYSHNGHFQIVRAHDGAMALQLLQEAERPIDLLILDLLMPPPDGFAVLRLVQTTPRLLHLPVIVVSACGFIDGGITSSMLGVTRDGGLSMRELMACTRTLIQTLNPVATNGVT